MNIPTAIEILSDSANRGITTFNQDFKDAEKLGIEALKRVREGREKGYDFFSHLLPGETEE